VEPRLLIGNEQERSGVVNMRDTIVESVVVPEHPRGTKGVSYESPYVGKCDGTDRLFTDAHLDHTTALTRVESSGTAGDSAAALVDAYDP
jgi:hypothetical protein